MGGAGIEGTSIIVSAPGSPVLRPPEPRPPEPRPPEPRRVVPPAACTAATAKLALTPAVEPYRCPGPLATPYQLRETPSFDPILSACPAATPQRRMFALTFDDGPNDPQTLQVLDYIEQFNITASFMIQGHSIYRTDKAAFVDERDVVRNVFKRGHMIASHSYCHHHMAAYTPELVRADTRACEDHLEELIGVRPRIYRPPFIEYSPTSMSILQAELGYTVVSANIYAEDTRYYSSLARTLENYRNAYWRRRTSYISLMHDSICSNHAALPTIIKTFSCAGYEFVSLDTCLGLESPYRDGKTNPAKRGRHDPQATCAALADISSLDELPDAPARSENASR